MTPLIALQLDCMEIQIAYCKVTFKASSPPVCSPIVEDQLMVAFFKLQEFRDGLDSPFFDIILRHP